MLAGVACGVKFFTVLMFIVCVVYFVFVDIWCTLKLLLFAFFWGMLFMRYMVVLVLSFLMSSAGVQSCISPIDDPYTPLNQYWLTIDDITNKPAGLIKIYYDDKHQMWVGQAVGGRLRPDRPDPRCTKCSSSTVDKAKGFGIAKDDVPLGKVIMWGYQQKTANRFVKGFVVNNEDGRKYRSDLELVDDGDRLALIGKFLIFSRTQIWQRLPLNKLKILCSQSDYVCLPLCQS